MNLPAFPEKPEVYGWLQRDRRGHWFLKGSLVARRSIVESFERGYQMDAEGRWFVQYGWQRVFVSLAHLPLLLRVDGHGQLRDAGGTEVGAVHRVALDAEGSLMLLTDRGPGALDDTDLAWALDRLQLGEQPVDDEGLAAALALPSGSPTAITWISGAGLSLAVERVDVAAAPAAFGFQPEPRPLRTALAATPH
jgi:hypothetical protein